MSVSYCLLVAYSMIVIVDKQTIRNNKYTHYSLLPYTVGTRTKSRALWSGSCLPSPVGPATGPDSRRRQWPGWL